ncbi:MAG: hypothetical protein ABH811_02225 [archaeon]
MGKIIMILTLMLMFFMMLFVILYFPQKITTGQAINKVQNRYTYTTTLCNVSNYCENYEITCEGNQIILKKPTGFIIQQSPRWEDLEINKELCK